MQSDAPIRAQLAKAFTWKEAHVDYDGAVANLSPALRGRRAEGAPHSPWELIEHIRIAQHDIYDFCVNKNYKELKWPDDYWPCSPEPPSDTAWDESIAAYHRDVASFQKLTEDPAIDITATIPHGSGQTYLREILLTIDHTSHHVGQLIIVRRLLGAWPAK